MYFKEIQAIYCKIFVLKEIIFMKNKKQRIINFALFLFLFALLPGASLTASAEIHSGTAGENITWEFDTDTGALTISGAGRMWDWEFLVLNGLPWYQYRDSIQTVIVSNSVTSIGNSAFFDCRSLTSVTITNSVTSIGDYAFSFCDSLTSVTIPESVTSIGNSAFFMTGLESVIIPDSVTTIGGNAFGNCVNLASVTIPNSVTSIGHSAFLNCSSLTSVTIPNSIISIENYAFMNCSSLINVTIPNSVTSIGNSAFYGCSSLTSVTIPNSVTSIESGAFYDCSSLTSVTISNSVTSIGGFAFSYCRNLSDVYFESATPPEVYNSYLGFVFNNVDPNARAIVPPSWANAGLREGDEWEGLIITYASAQPDEPYVHVENITVRTPDLTLEADDSSLLFITAAPFNATDKTITFTSSNPNVATVNSAGRVTGISPGTAVITVTEADGTSATVTVTVESAEEYEDDWGNNPDPSDVQDDPFFNPNWYLDFEDIPVSEYAFNAHAASVSARISEGELRSFATEADREGVQKYIVIVLDVSGSMAGRPLRELKEAAKDFCRQVLVDSDTAARNNIAIVAYSSQARVIQRFSGNYNTLARAIDGLISGGQTNMHDGLVTAEQLLNTVSFSPYDIRQIFLMSDGLPNKGPKQTGSYTISAYGRYANAVLETADRLKSTRYDLLTLGFFHKIRNTTQRNFAVKFKHDDLPSDKFKGKLSVVEIVDELRERFKEAARIMCSVRSIIEPELDDPITPNPDDPVTPNPDDPVTPDPDNPVTPDPDNPVTPDPDNPVMPEPDNPVMLDPDNPVTPDPDNPVTPDPLPNPDSIITLTNVIVRTGVLFYPIPILAGVGAIMIVTGSIMVHRSKRGEKDA